MRIGVPTVPAIDTYIPPCPGLGWLCRGGGGGALTIISAAITGVVMNAASAAIAASIFIEADPELDSESYRIAPAARELLPPDHSEEETRLLRLEAAETRESVCR